MQNETNDVARNASIHEGYLAWACGPRCTSCGGSSARAVRTGSAEVRGEAVYYLTYVWACTVCGEGWLDEGLARLNDWSADAARLAAQRSERWFGLGDGEHSAD